MSCCHVRALSTAAAALFVVASAHADTVAGKAIDGKTLQFREVMKDPIVFVVHPSNPVIEAFAREAKSL